MWVFNLKDEGRDDSETLVVVVECVSVTWQSLTHCWMSWMSWMSLMLRDQRNELYSECVQGNVMNVWYDEAKDCCMCESEVMRLGLMREVLQIYK